MNGQTFTGTLNFNKLCDASNRANSEVIYEWRITPNNPTQRHSKEHLTQKADPENKTTNIKMSCWNSNRSNIHSIQMSPFGVFTRHPTRTEVQKKLVIVMIKYDGLSYMKILIFNPCCQSDHWIFLVWWWHRENSSQGISFILIFLSMFCFVFLLIGSRKSIAHSFDMLLLSASFLGLSFGFGRKFLYIQVRRIVRRCLI